MSEADNTDIALAALTMQAMVLQRLVQNKTLTALDANTIVTKIGDQAAPDSNARSLVRRALKDVFPNARFN